MAKVLDDLYYSPSHEYVRVDGDFAYIGITDYAQEQLGNVVYVDMPEPGDELSAGSEFGAVESVKAASDLMAPVSGVVEEVNEILDDEPERILDRKNQACRPERTGQTHECQRLRGEPCRLTPRRLSHSHNGTLPHPCGPYFFAARPAASRSLSKPFITLRSNMTHKFLPHTDADIKAMLDTIGASNMEELYTEVPEALKLNRPVDLPPAMSEEEVRRHFEELGRKNSPLVCFAGDGVYDHYTPSVVAALTSRSEFQTSYTPYQWPS